MIRCVVDSSFAACWLLPDEKSPAADQLLAGHEAGDMEFIQPEQWFYELLNMLWVAKRRNRMGETEVADAFKLLRRLKVRSFPLHEAGVQERVWQLAQIAPTGNLRRRVFGIGGAFLGYTVSARRCAEGCGASRGRLNKPIHNE